MHPRDLAHNREAESAAFHVLLSLASIKALEYCIAFMRRNIGAVYHQDIKDASDADPTLFSVRGNYSLSKRTTLYVSGGYAMAKHDQKVSLSRDLVGAADTQAGVTAGIQHRF